MLFIIQNLPLSANITRIKQLIKDKCNISEVIVDNLINFRNGGQGSKQVTVGLADSSDAALFVKNINGLLIDGHQLYVEDVRQKKQSEYLHCPSPPHISNNSDARPPQHSLTMGKSMQVLPVPIPPMQMPVPMAYSNMPFYMTPVQPNSAQRNYVGNNTTAPLVNMSAQVPFYQQDSRFTPNKQNQNQWRAQAISYPIPGVNQKMQEPMLEQIDVKYNSPRKQESNWHNKNEGPYQSASVPNLWNSPQNFDVSLNNKSTRNERDIRQRSPRDRFHRDRSPRDRPSGDHSRDRPLREHSPRDRALRRRSPRERSRDRDYRRENDSQSRNRFSRADRSPPRSRRDGRDGRLDNHQDQRSQRPERPQRPERSQRPERLQRSERPQRPQIPQRSERSENDNHNRGYDHSKTPRDVDQRIHQNVDNQKRDFTPNLSRSGPFQQNPAVYSERSVNDNQNHDFDYRHPPCDIDQRINQNVNYQQLELPHSELFPQKNHAVFSSNPNNSTFVQSNANIFKTQKSVFQLSKIASMYDPEPREPPSKKMRVTGIERPHFNEQFNKSIPEAKLFSTAQPKFRAHPLQEPEGSLSVKLMKQNKWITKAAKILSKHIIANAKGGVAPYNPECLANLRKCITSRIDVVLGDRITNTLREITDAYRAKFSEDDDPGFFKAVMDKIERESKESLKSDDKEGDETLTSDIEPGPSNANIEMPNPLVGKFKLRAAKRNANFNIAAAYKSFANNGDNNEEEGYQLQNPRLNISKPSDPSKRLPNFPQGDKQIYKDQKKLQKLELHEEIYTLEPNLKKALDDEMALLCKEYTSACEEPADDKELYDFHEKIKNQTLPEFTKFVQLHMTKRLLNIPNNLVIRIFSHPKPPKRTVIDEFLKNYDVASLRKTEKKYQTFFLVTCASYESYDEILKLDKYKVSDTCTLQFRPMHLTGPKNNGNPAKLKRGKSNIPPENIIPLDEVEELLDESNMDIENLQNDESKLNIDEDVNDNQVYDENQVNIDQDGDNNENFDENILNRNYDIGNEFTNDDDITCDEFANCNDKPRLDDSDVVLLEKEHDIVVIDDNDKTLTEILDGENNDNGNEASNNDAKEEFDETAENDDGLNQTTNIVDTQTTNIVDTQSTNIVDEGTIEGVDVTEDDLEDF